MALLFVQNNIGVPVPSVKDFDWAATLKSKAKDGSCPEQQGKDNKSMNSYWVDSP